MGESNRWNNYAISTADLAQSLTKSSGSLVAANGTLEEAVALTATANTIIQDADVVGTALKTVAMRLRGTSTEEMEAEGLETDGVVTSKSKLQSKIKGLSGVDILTDAGAYKSTYQILSEIAEVWGDINDMDQAALLELLAGKRAGSVMSAILQNPETLKDAFESVNEAAGSAWTENEKYMDSIQGRLDLFTNAVQTMWNDTLNSDIMKGLINIGTGIIKMIDGIDMLGIKIGNLWTTVALVIASIIKFKNKMTWGEFFASINAGFDGWILKLKNLVMGNTAAISAMSNMTAKTLENAVATDIYTASQAAAIATTNGLMLSKTKLTAAEAVEMLTKGGMNQAEALNLVSKLKLTNTTRELTAATVEATMAQEGYTAAHINSAKASIFGNNIIQTTKQLYSFTSVLKGIPAMLSFGYQFGGIGGAFSQLGKGISMLWSAIPIVGKIMLIVGAITAVVKIGDAWIKTTEELQEELNELHSELNSITSDLDALNQELETTQSRMSELLAMDSLTFTEKEELDNLRKTNDELQRKIDLLELEKKQKNKEAAQKFVETRESDEGKAAGYTSSGKKTWLDRMGGGSDMRPKSISGEEYIEQQIEQYKKNQEEIARLEQEILDAGGEDTSKGKKLLKKKNVYEKRNEKIEKYFADKSAEWNKDIGDLEYFTGDDLEDWQIETNKWLDFINDTKDKWAMAANGKNAKSNAIKRIFNKEEFTDEAEQINKYVDALKAGDTSAAQSIQNIINNNEDLKQALANIGLDPQAAVDYFTQIGSSLGLGEIEEKIKDVEDAGNTLQNLLSGMKNGTLAIKPEDLFDADGKVIKSQISEIFKGIDEEIVADITKLLEKNKDAIIDGTVDINKLMAEYSLEGAEHIINAQKNVFASRTIELFPNLKDDIDGIIDTFDELAKAIGDVSDAMDTLDQARKEEAHSGSVSIETLSELMKYTDDYAKIVSIDETGAIHLAADAEKQLTEQKLQAIKDSAALAVQEAELALEKAKLAEGAVNAASAIGKTFVSALRGAAGVGAYVGSIFNSVKQAFSGWDWAHPIESAKNISFDWNTAKSNASKAKADAEAGSTVANWLESNLPKSQVENAEKNLQKAKDNQKIANGITSDNVQKRYQSDKADGSDSNDDDKRLENLQKKYEGKIKNLENQNSWLENEIAREEEIGLGISKSYYESKIDIEEKLIDEYEQERAELIELQKLYPEGSEKWYEVADAIYEVEHNMQESTKNIISNGKEIIALYDEVFSKIGEAYDDKISISDDRFSSMQNYAEILDLKGGTATKGLYDKMIAENKGKLDTQWEKFNENEKVLQDLYAKANPFEEGTDAWDAFELAREKAIIAASAEQRQLKLDMQDTEKQVLQLKEEFKELATEAWDNVRAAYDNRDTYYQNQISLNDKYISKLETLGINVPDEAYEAQIDSLEAASASKLEDYLQARQEMIDYEGIYGADSQEYIDKYNETIELHHEYLDYENQILEKQQQIFDNQIDRFNQVIDRINNATQRMSNISGLLEKEDVATEDGEWTSEGLTRLGMAYQQMEYYKQSSDEIADKMTEVERAYKRGEISEKKYYETMQELESQQWDMINSYEDMKDSIVDLNEARIDMIEEGIDKEIEAYSELIDLKKEELQAERDLYDFKKNIEKQTKDIATLERRIASMSGSTDASTIAERTKLEAELRNARDELDGSYRDHAYDSMSDALDNELESYEKNANDYIESLRESIKDTDLLIEQTYLKVLQNTDIVLETITTKSMEYGFLIDDYLTDPWENATRKSLDFETYASGHIQNIYDYVESMTGPLEEAIGAPYTSRSKDEKGNPLYDFSEYAKGMITKVIEDAEGKQDDMKDALDGGFEQAETSIQGWETIASGAVQNVIDKFTGENGLLAALNKTADRINSMPTYDGGYTDPTTSGNGSGGNIYNSNPNPGGNYITSDNVKHLQMILNQFFGANIAEDRTYGPDTKDAVEAMQTILREDSGSKSLPVNGEYNADTKTMMQTYLNKRNVGSWFREKGISIPPAIYAKGTMGTTRDQWAVTDESWIGEEITLAAGKNGQLQYLKKGSAVMPADISANLVEWGKLNPNMMNIGGGANLNMISNAVSKPEFNLSFEALVKAERIDENTLPEVKKFVQQEINTLVKQMNASIRKFK